MGTQQILMIVLSVIVVGAAVAVGIQMFDTQATNSQRTAIAGDLQNFGAQVLAYFRTPQSMGGGKGVAVVKANLADYLGFTGAGTTFKNANGTYTLGNSSTTSVVITGVDATTNGKINLTATVYPDSNKVVVAKS